MRRGVEARERAAKAAKAMPPPPASGYQGKDSRDGIGNRPTAPPLARLSVAVVFLQSWGPPQWCIGLLRKAGRVVWYQLQKKVPVVAASILLMLGLQHLSSPPPTCCQRFDLIYLILDKCEEERDRRLARHLVSLFHEHPPVRQQQVSGRAQVKQGEVTQAVVMTMHEYMPCKANH